MRRRGIGLGTTLIVVALVATLGFVVVSTSVSHLQVMSRTSNAALADDLARSALNLGLARIYQDRDFGTRTNEDRTLTVELPSAPAGSQGVLTFDPNRADLPLSTNNLNGPGSQIDRAGKMVPSQSVLLVAEGRCRGVTRHVEAVLHVPPFPYAAASDGPIVSGGGLQVGSLDANTPPGTPVVDLKPATILSNARDPQSIVLGPASTIKGDLLAGGGIQLDPGGGTNVIGQLYPNSDPRAVPRMIASDFDPGPSAAPLAATYNQADFTGKLRRDGDMEVASDLHLQGALLYVDGGLTVRGSLNGSGIVVTTGKLRIEGQAEMQGSDKVALLSQGGIELLGKGRASSNLRGVIYSEGGFLARQVRLEGALISNKGDQAAREVLLQDVSLLKDPSASKVTVQDTPAGPSNGQTTLYLDLNGQILSRENPPEPLPANYFIARVSARPDGRVDFFGIEYCNGVPSCSASGNGPPDVINTPGHQFYDALKGKLQPVDYQSMLDILFAPTPPQAPGGVTAGDVITVDPSALLPLTDSARIVLWRQY